jgi:hypothetical protein
VTRTHLIFDESGEWEVIEKVSEESPNIGVPVFSQALVVEPVYLGDLSRLMISAEDGHTVPIAKFEGHEEGDRLDGIVASVNVIAHEEIVCVW